MVMKKVVMVLTVGLFVGFVVLATGSSVIAMDHEVQTLTKEGIGNYLADAKGMTLYWFKKDSPGKSTCTGPCVEKWPVYYREKVKAGKGLKDGDFGTITREDGKKQSTFRGFPLYYWGGDKAKEDTGGQGLKDVWYVVDPSNFPPKM
jgi:predicted lipoprotein with Yx(FWY)xxD motif